MNILVVYDSLFGNTKQIAQTIAKTLSEFGMVRVEQASKISASALQDVDLLVLGCPTQGWRPTPAMLDFLTSTAPEAWYGVDVACFDTRFHLPRFLTGSAAQRIAQQMYKLGTVVLMPPESFFVRRREGPLEEGELKRADRWARALHHRIEKHSPVTHPM